MVLRADVAEDVLELWLFQQTLCHDRFTEDVMQIWSFRCLLAERRLLYSEANYCELKLQLCGSGEV